MERPRLTELLARIPEDGPDALDAVFAEVYEEIRLLAARQRARWNGHHTLDTTALVNEAYLKLVGQQRLDVRSRGHFFALASRAMRQLLCNYARDRAAAKRGGDRSDVPLHEVEEAAPGLVEEQRAAGILLDLDDALHRLADEDPRAVRVVECRFFGGLTVEETAESLGVSTRTVKRAWRFAQAWLRSELEDAG
jgi:RNA polymerase sigma factor (TIGR02999 family)